MTADVSQSDLVFDVPLGGKVTLAGVLSAVNRALPSRRTVVYDGGRFQGEAFKYIWSTDYRGEVLTTDFGAVGLGRGAAIRAASVAPGKATVLVTGDGGFMMNGLAELHSAIRAGLPLIVVICNDGSYGAEYDQFVNKGVRPDQLSVPVARLCRGGAVIGRRKGLTISNRCPTLLPRWRLATSPTRPVVDRRAALRQGYSGGPTLMTAETSPRLAHAQA